MAVQALTRVLASRRTLVALLVGAAAIRIAVLGAFGQLFAFDATGIIHGSTAYDTYARNLLDTGVYGLHAGVPDAVLPPLYSALLAAVYALAGRGALQVVILNTILDLAAILALRRLGARLLPGGLTTGTLAAAFTAFYPYLVFQSVSVSDTSLFIALLYVVLAATVSLRDVSGARAIWMSGAVCGALLGIAALARPIVAPLAGLVAIWFAATLGARAAARRLLPAALVAGLVLAPWLARNTRVYGQFVPVATNGGSNFWQGNNAQTIAYLRAGYDAQWVPPPDVEAADRLGPEAGAEMFQQALDYLRANPQVVPDLVWTKLRVQWSLDISPRVNPSADGPPAPPGEAAAHVNADGSLRLAGLPPTEPVVIYARPLFNRVGRSVHRLYWGGLLLLAVLGTWWSRRRWRDAVVLWCPAIALTIVYVVTHPSTRYRVPGDPALFLFAAVALLHMARAWTGRTRARPDRADALEPSRPITASWLGSARYSRPLDRSTARKWETLAASGIVMHVVAFSCDGRPRRFRQHAAFYLLPWIPVAAVRQALMAAAAPLVLLWLALRRDARIIVAQSPLEGAIGAAVKGILARVGRPAVLVVESHGDFTDGARLYRRMVLPRASARLRRRAVAFALRRADLGRAVSRATRDALQQSAPRLPVVIFPAWIDADAFAREPRAAPPGASRLILFAGTLAPIKGAHVLVEAFGLAGPRIAGARLVLAGPAPNAAYARALRARLAALSLRDVALPGELGTGELAGLMKEARIVVVPSLSEGLSRVALEAMLAGTPVVASRVGGLPEIVDDDRNGWLVPPADADALAGALVRAFASDDVDRLGVRARERARAIVSAEAYAAAYHRLLSSAARVVAP